MQSYKKVFEDHKIGQINKINRKINLFKKQDKMSKCNLLKNYLK